MLRGKTALITGASRGIGRAIALLYAEHGCNVAFTYIYENQEAEELTNLLLSKGIQVLCIQSDAADFEAAHSVVKQVVDTFGRLDILVCNAGISQDTLLMRMNEQQWDDVLNVNLKSVFNYCHAATPQMMRQRSGSIIAMSSVVGIGGNAGQTNYAASKAGIIGFIKSLSKELGSRNIRANAIAPGFILTDMTLALPENTRAEMIKMIPMRRCGEAEEVAKVALFLASDLSSYVSGQVISVNGAMG
ncbi:MAG: 3-oxoacyl-[acyl-carrier-protein] reductase [Paludibacteraceae bacterium]|nr:3-oxoacyl-[acyl-carrier-protein] reductase [Bacteroidales bacterium]MBO5013219.1 3-oxoacyl-[acyl-carrier-protein] reductase [Paludibacteraceae bacterium]MBP3574903.1 3-oxoacyl-[acyl-carrier-protein] reductase [Paludibacteraceae bacterium]